MALLSTWTARHDHDHDHDEDDGEDDEDHDHDVDDEDGEDDVDELPFKIHEKVAQVSNCFQLISLFWCSASVLLQWLLVF